MALESGSTTNKNDVITADESDDSINSGNGSDVVDGGFGDDTIYGDGYDGVQRNADGSVDLSSGTAILGRYDADGNFYAGERTLAVGNDLIYGGNGAEIIYGDNGNDPSGGGSDIAYAGNGNDRVYGEGGEDVLAGESGADTLSGGAGNDVFVYNAVSDSTAAAPDLITDFGVGDDVVRVTGANFTSQPTVGDGSSVGANQIQMFSSGGITTLYIGTDATPGADIVIKLDGTFTLSQLWAHGTDIGLSHAPVATDDAANALEDGGAVTVNVLANDTDADIGDTRTVTAVDTTATIGSVSITNGGADVSYDPGANFQSLGVGDTATDTFGYTVTDSLGKTATATVTVTIAGTNDGPGISAAVSSTASEDDGAYVVNLLQGASDPDASDVLHVANVTGLAAGVTLVGDTLQVDPNAYNSLAVGEHAEITVHYDIVDGRDGSVAQTATITITGANDAPVVDGTVSSTANEDAAGYIIDLLQNASDIDTGDTLSVANVAETTGHDASGVSLSGNGLVVDPSAYNHLAVGESVKLHYTYDVFDGTVNTPATADITIEGRNDAPSVSAAVSSTASEDAPTYSVDLLQGASDPDTTDVLHVANVTGLAAGVTLVGDTLQVDPNAYNSLAVGERADITVNYDVVDGNEGTVAQTATITITGVNDAPTITSGDQTGAVTESADSAGGLIKKVDEPIEGPAKKEAGGEAAEKTAEDPENATLHTASGIVTFSDIDTHDTHSATYLAGGAGYLGSFSLDAVDQTTHSVGWHFSVDDAVLNSLQAGEILAQTYVVMVDDGHGGTASQDVAITIIGANDVPIITSAAQAGAVTEATDNAPDENSVTHTASGAVNFSDMDTLDTHTATVSPTHSGYLGTFELDADDSVQVTEKSVGWHFSVPDSALDSLRADTTLTQIYTITVDDGHGGTASQDVVIRIQGANDAPIAAADSYGVDEDHVLSVTAANGVLANDSDVDATDTLIVTSTGAIVTSLGAMVTMAADGSFTYDPTSAASLQALNTGNSAVDTFTYTISDGHGGAATATATITVAGIDDNHAPVASDDVLLGTELIPAGFMFNPANGHYYALISGSGGWLAMKAAAEAMGGYLATVTSAAENGFIFTGLDIYSHGYAWLGASDDVSQGASEANWKWVTGPEAGTLFWQGGLASFGGHTVDGQYANWRPETEPNDLSSENFGMMWNAPSVAGEGTWNDGQLSFSIRGIVEIGGRLGDPDIFTSEDAAKTVAATTLLANDTDVDAGDVLSVTGISSSSALGALVSLENGVITYDPTTSTALQALTRNATLDDSFTYTIADGHGGTSAATASFRVIGVNDTPVIEAALTNARAVATELPDMPGGLDPDADPDADGVPNGVDNAPFVANHDQSDADSDGVGDVADIEPLNASVGQENASTHTRTGTIAFADVELTDTHSVLSVTPHDGGIGYLGGLVLDTVDQSANAVGWTFTVADSALDSLPRALALIQMYDAAISDGHGGTVTQTITITITGTNDAPTLAAAIADPAEIEAGAAFSYPIPLETFADADAGDILTYSATLDNGNPLPSWLVFNAATQTFSGTPGPGDAGVIIVEVTASDTGGLSASDTFALTVNAAPAIVLTTVTPGNDILIPAFSLLGNDAAESGTFTIATVGNAAPGDSVALLSSGDVVYTDNAPEDGSFTYTVFDGATESAPIMANVDTQFNIDFTGQLIFGTSANEILIGGSGREVLIPGGGTDYLFGGEGIDVLYYSLALSGVTVSLAIAGPQETGEGTVILSGDIENLRGSNFADSLAGDSGNNLIFGLAGDDTLMGDAGDDGLDGNIGNDILVGGDRNDLLFGGPGDDTMSGGAGADSFNWTRADPGVSEVPAIDTLTDFDLISGSDKLNLRALLDGENSGNLGDYLDFNYNSGTNTTTVDVRHAGGTGDVTQQIVLENFNITAYGADENTIISNLLSAGKLIVDL